MGRLTASALLLCVVAALAALQGYELGQGHAEARHKAALLAQIEAGQKLEGARREAARQRDELAHKLEVQAHADPVVVHRCIGPSRVRRLNALR